MRAPWHIYCSDVRYPNIIPQKKENEKEYKIPLQIADPVSVKDAVFVRWDCGDREPRFFGGRHSFSILSLSGRRAAGGQHRVWTVLSGIDSRVGVLG